MLTYKKFIVVSVLATSLSALLAFPATAPASTRLSTDSSAGNLINLTAQKKLLSADKPEVSINKVPNEVRTNKKISRKNTKTITVPFYSQFKDISSQSWQKVGCGIASVAMIIGYYEKNPIPVNELLETGIASGAFDDNAGWSHQGLINLAKKYNLDGESHSLANDTLDNAFIKLETVLRNGPVMASVHYTFEPTNPIPHLVVVNSVRNGEVYYNDPAEESPNGHISIDKFKKAWKKRYIEIRPTV